TDVLASSPSDLGGFKEVTLEVRGPDAYGRLKYEAGVHRVQRVPVTESQGRIHTSTATVAVMPEAEEVEVDLRPEDLQIDVYRSSGPGGQSVNTTDSAVRIVHKPSGIKIEMQEERSQLQNREKAMRYLRARLYQLALDEAHAKEAAARRAQLGTGSAQRRSAPTTMRKGGSPITASSTRHISCRTCSPAASSSTASPTGSSPPSAPPSCPRTGTDVDAPRRDRAARIEVPRTARGRGPRGERGGADDARPRDRSRHAVRP